ncbi:S9 family peptidase [bacterium]|nr:S9 family peptidase [bacterium]
MFRRFCILLRCACFLSAGFLAAQPEPSPVPPVAAVKPVTLEKFGHARIDHYFWLRERDDPEVLQYLQDENAYTRTVMSHTQALQDTLFSEFRNRVKQTDVSVPYRMKGYFYYSRKQEGKEYDILCRKKGSLEGREEILLDQNEMSAGHDYFSLGSWRVSPDGRILAFAVDTVGRRFYTVLFKDLKTGSLLADRIPSVTPNMAWANDNRTLFYAQQDPNTLRSYRILRHGLGDAAESDKMAFEEKDETFSCYVTKTKSDRYLQIISTHTLATEWQVLDADHPDRPFRTFLPRRMGHEYLLDHHDGHFYIVTNDSAKNFRLMRTPEKRTARSVWEEVIPHRPDVLLENIEVFKDYCVVQERKNGLIQLQIRPWSGAGSHYLDFGEPAYMAYPRDNHEMDSRLLRFLYTSMTTPVSLYDYDMQSREKRLLKREEILGGFDPANYRTERLYAKAPDGTAVPLSIVYREELKKDGGNPLLLYGYGSYGASMDASFNANRISLLDRGFVYAIGHVRGGQELGRSWYEDGRQLKKKNTFTDFIACAEHLIREGYTAPDRLFIEGASAGGLLIGAVINMRPDLFKAAVAAVPFVDVVTTMLDETIPLTTGEYDEWGNPNDRPFYDYMLSYSPYDNVEPKTYPHLLVLTSLQDSQVQYWEPAKWVAKLRAVKTDSNLLLLKTEMDGGHGGVSGRYKRYREAAFQYAFLLDQAGIGK